MKQETKNATPSPSIPVKDELFTGGEWVVKTKDGDRMTRVETNDEFCYTVCDCYNDEVKPYEMIGIEQAEANAALISQAPAMYRALKNIIQRIDTNGIYEELPPSIKLFYADAKDILKKATPNK